MGQIEWAMWANEQALASGLSECAPAAGPGRAGTGRGRAGAEPGAVGRGDCARRGRAGGLRGPAGTASWL